MTDFYYNHCVYEKAGVDKVVSALEELRDLGQFLRDQGHRLFLSQFFWSIKCKQGKLHDLLKSSVDFKKNHGDLVQLILEYVMNGPFYPQTAAVELSAQEIPTSDHILYSCFTDQQSYLISSQQESKLVKERYIFDDLDENLDILATLKSNIQAKCAPDFQVYNSLGQNELKAFMASLTPFVSIDDVFEKVKLEFPEQIVILKDAKKSARRHKFESLDRVYEGLHGLVTEYLPGLKEGLAKDRFQTKLGIQCSGESECTKNLYGNERKFQLPDGRKELFEMHFKLGRKTRIHFFVDGGVVYIGHCGKHLSICDG